jgi:hypothetical protein
MCHPRSKLADAIVTALFALEAMTGKPDKVLAEHLDGPGPPRPPRTDGTSPP